MFNKMINSKIVKILLIITLLFQTVASPLYASDFSNINNYDIIIDKPSNIDISEYHKYSNYEITLDSQNKSNNEKDQMSMYLFLENLVSNNIATEEIFLNGLNIEKFDANLLNSSLSNYEIINEFAKIEDLNATRFVIDYNTKNNERVILEYYNSGVVNKSIYSIDTEKIIVISSNLTKQMYTKADYKDIKLELSQELKEKINSFIDSSNYQELEKIPEIKVNRKENETLIELNNQVNQDIYSSATTSSAKTNAFPVTNSFPSYTKKIVMTKTVYSSALANYNFPDKNVYSKVKESRDTYIQQTFEAKLFAINTTLTAIGIFTGNPVTYVELLVYYAGIAVGVVGTAKSIIEAAEIAKDAQYSYRGERSGYVYDKTAYNSDVKVVFNISSGTFDGGNLPDGRWAWIESPRASAYEVSSDTITNNTIYNYNASINIYGYCASYYPE